MPRNNGLQVLLHTKRDCLGVAEIQLDTSRSCIISIMSWMIPRETPDTLRWGRIWKTSNVCLMRVGVRLMRMGMGRREGVKETGSGPKMIGGGAGSQALCTDNHNPSSALLS